VAADRHVGKAQRHQQAYAHGRPQQADADRGGFVRIVSFDRLVDTAFPFIVRLCVAILQQLLFFYFNRPLSLAGSYRF
jgi:hypothetical protein